MPSVQALAKDTIIYGASEAVAKVASVVLIPLYTHFLSGPAEYGAVELLTVFSTFLIVFVELSLSSAMFKVVLYNGETCDNREVFSSAFWCVGLAGTAALVVVVPAAGGLSALLVGVPGYGRALQFTAVSVVLGALGRLPLTMLRMDRRAKPYGAVNICAAVAQVLVTVLLLLWFQRLSALAVVITWLVRDTVRLLAPLAILKMPLYWAFSTRILAQMLRFSLPLVPIGLSSIVLDMSDRYILSLYGSLEDVGIYSLGYRAGFVMALLVSAFQTAWPTFMFSAAKDDSARGFYTRVLNGLVAGLCAAVLLLSLFAREIVSVLAPAGYSTAHVLIPLVSLAYVLQGVYYATAVGTNLKARTELQTYAVLAAAGVNVVLNFILIPVYGIMGAAVATLVAFAVMAGLSARFALGLFYINYGWHRLVAVMAGTLVVSEWAQYMAGIPLPASLLLRLAIIGSYVAAVTRMGLVRREDLNKAVALLKDLMRDLGAPLVALGQRCR